VKRLALILAAAAVAPAVANADTLYVSQPVATSPGHPLRLMGDHKASQVGDLIGVQFNFSVTSSSTDVVNTTKSYNVGMDPGTGNAALSFLRFPTSIGGGTGTQSNHTKNGSNNFQTTMMAQVVGVEASGALDIAGDQQLIVNGQTQSLHVTGIVRPEDIDAADTVLSSRIANVQANFNGNFQEKNKGLIRRILDVLF
jgi:flagellar L-ring protein FlgH